MKCTYHISIRRHGNRRGTVDRDTAYSSRREAVEAVMALVDSDSDITGATVYRQRYWSNPQGPITSLPSFFDPVVSMTRAAEGTVKWRDTSGHKDAAYLKEYER